MPATPKHDGGFVSRHVSQARSNKKLKVAKISAVSSLQADLGTT